MQQYVLNIFRNNIRNSARQHHLPNSFRYVALKSSPKCTNTLYVKYADDLSILIWSQEYSILVDTCHKEIEHLTTWCADNYMIINNNKTPIMHIGNQKRTWSTEIKINDTKVHETDNVKLLGVWIQSNLKWNLHVEKVLEKSSVQSLSSPTE